jgi:hypothetical protein
MEYNRGTNAQFVHGRRQFHQSGFCCVPLVSDVCCACGLRPPEGPLAALLRLRAGQPVVLVFSSMTGQTGYGCCCLLVVSPADFVPVPVVGGAG